MATWSYCFALRGWWLWWSRHISKPHLPAWIISEINFVIILHLFLIYECITDVNYLGKFPYWSCFFEGVLSPNVQWQATLCFFANKISKLLALDFFAVPHRTHLPSPKNAHYRAEQSWKRLPKKWWQKVHLLYPATTASCSWRSRAFVPLSNSTLCTCAIILILSCCSQAADHQTLLS